MVKTIEHTYSSFVRVNSGAYKYAKCIGLPGDIAMHCLTEIDKWIKDNGLETTVKRLKEYKLCFLKSIVGGDKSFYSPWLTYKVGNMPANRHFRALFKLPEKYWRKVYLFLQVYTYFKYPSLTVEQKSKFSSAVTGDFSIATSEQKVLLHELVKSGMDGIMANKTFIKIPKVRSVYDYAHKPSKSIATIDGKTKETGLVPRTGMEFLAINALHTHRFRKFLEPVVSDSDFFKKFDSGQVFWLHGSSMRGHLNGRVRNSHKPLIGYLSVIQERGGKARYIANPHPIYQLACSPYADSIFEILKGMRHDYTHDQLAGVETLGSRAARGNEVAYCYDLSNATDRFPLSLQLEVINRLYGSEVSDFLESLCTAEFRDDTGTFPGGKISWRCGQPLGLRVSFPMFALTHHALVWGLFWALKKQWPGPLDYGIVGDDVVIFDQQVAQYYRESMTLAGCEINVSKSFQSETEFNFLGHHWCKTPSGKSIEFKPFKWLWPDENNFVEIARGLGSSVKDLITDQKMIKVLDRLSDIPSPIGLGWNPNGEPLDSRMNRMFTYVELLLTKRVTGSFNTLTRQLNNLLYADQSPHPYGRFVLQPARLAKLNQSSLIDFRFALGSHLATLYQHSKLDQSDLYSRADMQELRSFLSSSDRYLKTALSVLVTSGYSSLQDDRTALSYYCEVFGIE